MRTALVALVILPAAMLHAQAPASPERPTFEVATIRASAQATGIRGGSCSGTEPAASGPLAAMAGARGIAAPPPGVCQFTAVTVRNLIGEAYGLGLEPDDELTGGPAWVATTRFDVRAKAERQQPRAALRLMLRTPLADRFGHGVRTETREADGLALTVAGTPKLAVSTRLDARSNVTRIAGKPMVASHTSMADLAGLLSGALRRPVVDATGLGDR